MPTKEEYLDREVQKAMNTFGSLSSAIYDMVRRLAEASAERDAALAKVEGLAHEMPTEELRNTLAADHGKLVKPPETRPEMLVALVDLAVELGDRDPITSWDEISILVKSTSDERAMLRAHLAKKAADGEEAKS